MRSLFVPSTFLWLTALAALGCTTPSGTACPATYARLPDGTCVCPLGTHELHAMCVADVDGAVADTGVRTDAFAPDTGVGADAFAADTGADSGGPRHCDPWVELLAPSCLASERCSVPADGSSTGDCVPNGTVALGEPCTPPTTGYDDCVRGAQCDHDLNICLAYCSEPTAECVGFAMCFGDMAAGTLQGICFPTCDMFDVTSAGCAGGFCLAGRALSGVTVGSCFARLDGTRALGEDCSTSALCEPGAMCSRLVPSLGSSLCLEVCDPAHPCTGGSTCTTWSGSADIGLCVP